MKIAHSFTRILPFTCGLLMLAAGQLAAQVGTALTSNNLSFAHQLGSQTSTQPQTVRVLSNPSNLTYTATVTTTGTTSNWLLVNGATSANGTTGAATQDLSVSVNTLGLAAGTYTGSIAVTVTGASANTLNVTLTVNAAPQVTVSPTSLFLSAQAGTSTSTVLNIGSTGAAVPFTAAVTSISPNFPIWLSVTPTNGNTGSTVTVIANTTGLNATLAVGTITFSTPGGGNVTVPVLLNAGAAASTLVVSPTSTNIGFQLGTQPPGARQINVTTSSSSAVPFTAQVTSGAWLTLSSVPTSLPGSTVLTGTTPGSFYAVANPAGLAAGTYEGRVLITSVNLPGSSQEVAVRLVVSASPVLNSSPESVTFNHTLGTSTPAGTLVSITSGQQLPYTAAAATTTGGDWLVVSPTFGTTNLNSIQISLNPTRISQLAAGAYQGTVSITAAGAANSPFTIPVTLNVSGSTLINVNPSSLNFNLQTGQTPAAQSITVASTDGSSQPFTVGIEYAGTTTGWLLVSPSSGSTGTTGVLVTANVIPTAITTAGTYDATIVVTPTSVAGTVPARIPVRLTAIGSAAVTASPTSFQFAQAGTTAPQGQSLTLTSTVSGLNYIAASSAPWLTVAPASGTISSAPGTVLAVGVTTTGLTPGTLNEANITISVSGVTTLTIPVKFAYQTAALGVAPAQLRFEYQTGAAAPAAQNIGLTSNAAAISFTAAATTTTGGNWLSVNPASGTTAASGGAAVNVAVTANPTGLAAGTYNGTVTITSSSASNSPQTVPVTLVVTTVAPPAISQIMNAASNAPTVAVPGLIMAIKGTNLGPATGVGAQVQNGFVTTTAGDVRVTFDNVAAPILFARQDQVNVVVPYFVGTQTSTRMVVEYRGQRSDSRELRVAETAPAIFTADATGTGQGAVLNQDNTVNGPNNAAARGSIVVLYATGEGQVIPAGSDGRVITPTDLRRPVANVSVRIGGQAAEVLYAGSAPGLVSGALQVNVRVPANLQVGGPSPVPVEIVIGSGSSATVQNATITVRP